MPLIKLYMARREGFDKQAVAASLRAAMREILAIPVPDGPVLYCEFDGANWQMPEGWPQEQVFMEVTLYPGRKAETKGRLLAELNRRLAEGMGIAPTSIITTLHEPPLENWGVRGGGQASRVGVSYRTDV